MPAEHILLDKLMYTRQFDSPETLKVKFKKTECILFHFDIFTETQYLLLRTLFLQNFVYAHNMVSKRLVLQICMRGFE